MLENKGVFPIEEATMDDSRKGEVTGLLVAWKNGSPEALDEPAELPFAEHALGRPVPRAVGRCALRSA